MKITQSRSKSIKYGSKGSKSFGVNTNNSKFFRVMSDTLYTDKIGSIIRELSSNAIDGQRAQGNLEKPFDIFLPCKENPKFCIRDYGTGLSPDDIESVYTRYFESTKDQNEDDIGGFGLGAKTPFAYTDSFIVRSYFNGKVYTYTIAFSGDQPEYELQFVQDTDEPNGLEVYFDVDAEDFNEFSTKAFRTLIWFDHIPNVWTGSLDENGFFKTASNFNNYRESIQNFRKENCFEDDNMIFCPTNYVNPFSRRSSELKSRICVIQGGILYPVSTSASEEIKTFSYKIPYGYTIVTKHKIGEISLAPSREQIEEKKETIKNIENKIDVIFQNSKNILKEIIADTSNSKFKTSAIIQNLRQRSRNFGDLKKIEDCQLEIASEEDKIAQECFLKRFGETLLDYKKRIENFEKLVPLFENDKVSAYTKHGGHVKPKKVKNISEMRFATNSFNNIHIVLRDSSVSAQIQAVMNEVNIRDNELVFVIDTYKKTLKNSVYIDKLDYLKNIKEKIIAYLECSDIDMNVVHESNIIKKELINNVRVYEKNTYAVFEKPYGVQEVSSNSIDSISKYLDKNIVYAIKQGHGNATLTLSNKINSDKESHSFLRSEIAEMAYYASVMFDIKYDYLVFVNKKELRDIQKNSSGKVIELGQFIEDVFNNNVNVFDGKIKTLKNILENQTFVRTFKDTRNLMKTFQMIGEPSKVKKLDEMMAKHSDDLYSDNNAESFEMVINHVDFVNTPASNMINISYYKNIQGVINKIYEMSFSNNVFKTMAAINSNLKKTIQEKAMFLSNIKTNEDMLALRDFLNDENLNKFPILKLVKCNNCHDFIDADIGNDIEEFVKMKISEKKCEKVAA